jgi:hypothetical protein
MSRVTPEPSICDAFSLIADLALAHGALGINKLPGCWVHKVDEHWTLAVNAHPAPVDVTPDGTMGAEVPPFTAAVWWHGWLAGLIGPGGGSIAAHPEGANEDRLIADLQAAIAKVEGR